MKKFSTFFKENYSFVVGVAERRLSSVQDAEEVAFEDRLFISPSTGEILAAETLYIGSDRTDIESPSVIDYTLWER